MKNPLDRFDPAKMRAHSNAQSQLHKMRHCAEQLRIYALRIVRSLDHSNAGSVQADLERVNVQLMMLLMQLHRLNSLM